MHDQRNIWIEKHVPGKSFADLGGLWGTVNEKVTVALDAKAASATMIDIAPLGHELWVAFEDHVAAKGSYRYDKLSADLNAPDIRERIGSYDVVHSSGVIYHVPNLIHTLNNYHAITREHLILTSMVMPEVIENEQGTLGFGPDTCYFVPALSAEHRAIITVHLDRLGLKLAGINVPLTEEWISSDGVYTYGPWWWLYSPSFLRSLLETCRFTIVEEGPVWEQRSYGFVARV